MLAVAVENGDLEHVRSLERRRIDATRANDAEGLASILHDGLIYVNSVGEIYDKERYLRVIRTNCLTYEPDFDVLETQVRVFDNLIILAGTMIGHSRLEGEQQVLHFRSIGVWRKEADDWQLLAWQSSSGSIPS
jgi:ketosteroid isomerase-like protein